MRSTLGIGLLKGILLHGCHLHLCETVRTPTPKKLEKEWIKWLFQRKSLKINQRIGFCHFGFFGTFLTTFSLELLYELVDSMSTSFQASKARPKDKIIHITMTLITILLNTICIFFNHHLCIHLAVSEWESYWQNENWCFSPSLHFTTTDIYRSNHSPKINLPLGYTLKQKLVRPQETSFPGSKIALQPSIPHLLIQTKI